MGHVGSRRALWRDHPGAWGRSLDRLSSRGAPAAFLGRREFDVGRLYRRNDAGGMLHGDRDVSCDADDKGDSPADRHAWLAAARHEPTVVEAVAYHDCRDICVHIVTLRAHVTASSEPGDAHVRSPCLLQVAPALDERPSISAVRGSG